MTMGSSWKKDRRGMRANTATVRGAAGSAAKIALSVSNSTANKTRDNAWRMGDQAMKKTPSGTTRGCFV
jgi:hypothetical protein